MSMRRKTARTRSVIALQVETEGHTVAQRIPPRFEVRAGLQWSPQSVIPVVVPLTLGTLDDMERQVDEAAFRQALHDRREGR